MRTWVLQHKSTAKLLRWLLRVPSPSREFIKYMQGKPSMYDEIARKARLRDNETERQSAINDSADYRDVLTTMILLHYYYEPDGYWIVRCRDLPIFYADGRTFEDAHEAAHRRVDAHFSFEKIGEIKIIDNISETDYDDPYIRQF